jgi:hypothetical protein
LALDKKQLPLDKREDNMSEELGKIEEPLDSIVQKDAP